MRFNVTVEQGNSIVHQFSYDAPTEGSVARGIQRGFRESGHRVSIRGVELGGVAFPPLQKWTHRRTVGSDNANIHSGSSLRGILQEAGIKS